MTKLLFPISLIIVIALGIVDYLTGYELAFSLFYVLPISVLTWFKRIRYGIIISIFSAIVWFIADWTSGQHYSNSLIPLWNMLMRLTTFIIIVYLINRVKKELEIEKMLSNLDMLTGLNNTRSFFNLASIEKNRSSRLKRPFTIAYFDIDNFKLVNDTFGHAKGDILLQNIRKVIKDNLREYDIPARLGGDEFIVLFPETDKAQADVVVNKVKLCVEKIMKEYSNLLTPRLV